MLTENKTEREMLLWLLKDFSAAHTVTSLAHVLKKTRVGIWKNIKKLNNKGFILVSAIGAGKTNTRIITPVLSDSLLEKILSVYLTEQAFQQKRWKLNFGDLEKEVDFLILYGSILHSPEQAKDIDILVITAQKNFIKIQQIIDKIQKTQHKKIHAVNFTKEEFKQELKKENKVFIDALKKGVVLYKQENFVEFMKKIQNE